MKSKCEERKLGVHIVTNIITGSECIEAGIDYYGNDLKQISNIPSAQECACACRNHDRCLFFTWNGHTNVCYLKDSDKGRTGSHSQAFSGSLFCCNGKFHNFNTTNL